jgi:hypothetical protein
MDTFVLWLIEVILSAHLSMRKFSVLQAPIFERSWPRGPSYSGARTFLAQLTTGAARNITLRLIIPYNITLSLIIPYNITLRPVAPPNITLRRRECPQPDIKANTPIFKGSIGDALVRTNCDDVPFFVTAIMERVAEKKDIVGIYRKSGLQTNIDLMTEFIDHNTDPSAITEFLDAQLPHDLACTLKLYIRTLSLPVIPIELTEEFKNVLKETNVRHAIQRMKLCVTALPTPHYNLFKAFARHIEDVLKGENQMTISSIALVVGGNFFKSTAAGGDVFAETSAFQNIVAMIFENWRFIFLNEPLEINDLYVMTVRDVQLPLLSVNGGQRLKVISVAQERSQITVEMNGKQFSMPSDDLTPVDDSDVPPVFWVHFDGQVGFLTLPYLAPSDLPEPSVEKVKEDIRKDLAELARIESALERASSEEETDEIGQVLAKF